MDISWDNMGEYMIYIYMDISWDNMGEYMIYIWIYLGIIWVNI